jgi:hypothetical protein
MYLGMLLQLTLMMHGSCSTGLILVHLLYCTSSSDLQKKPLPRLYWPTVRGECEHGAGSLCVTHHPPPLFSSQTGN